MDFKFDKEGILNNPKQGKSKVKYSTSYAGKED